MPPIETIIIFFTNLLNSVPQVDSHHLILGGDMNMVMNPVLDLSSNKPFSVLYVYSEQSMYHKWHLTFFFLYFYTCFYKWTSFIFHY